MTAHATQWTYSKAGQMGTIVNRTIAGGVATPVKATLTYGANGAPASGVTTMDDGTTTNHYTYDGAGRQTTRTINGVATQLKWDVSSNLVETDGAGGHFLYAYDASGQRVAKIQVADVANNVKGVVAGYLGSTELTDADTANNANLAVNPRALEDAAFVTGTRYYAFGGATVAVRQVTAPVAPAGATSTLSLMFGDEQGSATVMMQVALDGTTGAMAPASVTEPLSRNAYTPYGAVRGADNLTISKGWLNQVSDEASTGLVYLNARYYDTGTSRFVSPDPLMNPADPKTLDAFRYADNNPVTYTDASGLGPVCTGLSGTALTNCETYGKTTVNFMTGAKKQPGPGVGQVFGALGKGGGRTLWDTIWAIAIEPMGAVQIARFAASPSFYVKEKWDQASAARSAWWSSTKSARSFFTGGGQTWSGHWKQVDQDFTGGVYHGDDTLAKWQTSGSLGMTVLITLFGPKVIKSFGIEPGVAADSESSLLRSANAARDAELSRLTGVRSAERPATVVGAYNTRTGSVAVGSSSKVLAECAEACAARNVGGDIADIGFTTAFRPNGSGAPFRPVRVCEAFCEPTYGRDAFSDPSTLFQSDQ